MKLAQVYEENIPVVFNKKDVNGVSKKPKKLKKGFYGGPVLGGHSTDCNTNNGGDCSCTDGSASGGAVAGGGE